MKAVIFGPLGAGKGIHCQRLQRRTEVEHVEMGKILRDNKDTETPYGAPREYMEEGEFVPDELVNDIVERVLTEKESFILDGYPRTLDQAEFLSSIADLSVMVYMHVDDETTIDRLTNRRICESCDESYHPEYKPPATEGICDFCDAELVERNDDDEETIRRRIAIYEERVVPVIEHYRDELEQITIDAERPYEEVWKDFSTAIEPHLQESTTLVG